MMPRLPRALAMPRVSPDLAGERQRLLVQVGGPREVTPVVRAVAEVVKGPGEVALVAEHRQIAAAASCHVTAWS